jgi:hypothetical protein
MLCNHATVEVKNNLIITARERGKLVTKREGHNIWLNLGREYMAQLMSYSLMSPLTTVRDDRIRYMGMGIGGTRQLIPSIANNATFVAAYPGTNLQTDENPAITVLERPIRVSGTSTPSPYDPADVWLGQIQAPASFPAYNQVVYRRLFMSYELNYNPYTVAPVSEVGLFTNAANPLLPHNVMLAYDTFETIAKTDAVELEVAWTISF